MKSSKIKSAADYNDLFTLSDARKIIYNLSDNFESFNGRTRNISENDVNAIDELKNIPNEVDSRLSMENIEKTLELQSTFDDVIECEDESLTANKFISLIIKGLLFKIQTLEDKLVRNKLKYKKKIAKLENDLYKSAEWNDKLKGTYRRDSYKFLDMAQKWHEDYTTNDVVMPMRIIFNDPATIVFWTDGTKTVVKKHELDKKWDAEKALYAAIVKRFCGVETIYGITDITKNNPKHEEFSIF